MISTITIFYITTVIMFFWC